MTLPLFFGCVFIAYGPAIVIFFGLVWKRAPLLLLCCTSAFFWLLSVFLVSILWTVIPPLKDSHAATVVVGALTQEVFRGLYLLMYRKAEEGMNSLTAPGEPLPLNDLSSAIAAGLGFGTMGSVVMYGSLLATSVGEAVLYSDQCSEMSLFALSAVSSTLFIILHTLLSILTFDAYRRRSWARFSLVVLLHLGASLCTLANESSGGCVYSPLLVAGMLFVALGACIFIMRAPDYAGTRQAKRWEAASRGTGL